MGDTREDKSMRYLLGKLSEQETAEFQAQCFDDDDLFSEMVNLENDLLHSYIRGEFSTAERQEFETGYLISPARRWNLEFARALEHRLFETGETPVSPEPEPLLTHRPTRAGLAVQSWPVRLVAGAIALTAIAAISWLAVIIGRLNVELGQLKTQQVESRRTQQELQAQLDTLRAHQGEGVPGSYGRRQFPYVQPPGPDTMAFNLTPGLPRSAGTIQQLILPSRVLLVTLKLYLEDDKYSSYRASLGTIEGKQIWRKTGLKSQMDSQGHRFVSLEIPPDILNGGDYLVKLDGAPQGREVEEIVVAYRFSIARH